MPWVIFILSVLHSGIISGGVTINFLSTNNVPKQGNSLQLSCFVNTTSDDRRYDTTWSSPTIVDFGHCYREQKVCTGGTMTRQLTADENGSYLNIKVLNRSLDEGRWKCRYNGQGQIQAELYVTVYTIPSRLDFIQMTNMDVDLSVTSTQLRCTTFGCTYPSPLIQWLVKDQTASSSYEVYATHNPTVSGGPCVFPEQPYTSTLDLQQNTTWSDNSDRIVIFSCRIEYPDSSMNLITSGLQSIRSAVRVTEAFLQYNNQNITSTLTVTSGEQVTLTCVTGTSRPAPNIDWYIGSRLMGIGTRLIFTPSNTDHSEVIFCQAYNTDTNLRVDSNKPSLFVRVRVTEAFLQQNNQNITSTLTVTSGESFTLTCVTGTSRPAPNIDWYIGSRPIRTGTNLIFAPSNTDHNEMIYCQAYNIDPNQNVESDKLRLFVRVQVSSIALEGSSGGKQVFNERYPQTLKCNSSPSRPVPKIRWLLDNKNMTDNITNINITYGDGLYVLKSEITLVLMRNSSNQKIRCEGFISGQETKAVSTGVIVDVRYAPDVRVNISGYTVVNSTVVLMCTPQGNPPQYTFHQWIHKVEQTEIRRLDGVQTSNISTLILSNISIQDTGTYICTVDNAIPGLNRQVYQAGDTDVYVQGLPVSDKTQLTFAGEPNKSANIEILFYSYPSIKLVKFINQLDSSEISNTSNIAIYIAPANVTMMFYERKVMRPGHVAVLYFRNMKNTDSGNYTLQLSNDQGTVSLQFDFITSAAPSMPKKFFFIDIQDGHLVFGIEKGCNGAHDQTFIVEYQPSGMPKAAWLTVFKINENDLDDPFSNGTYYITIPKIQDGHYVFRVYAENRKGNSSAVEGVYVEIKTEEPSPVVRDVSVGEIAGGVVGGILLVSVIVVVAVVIKRRTLKPKMEEIKRRVTHGSQGTEYVNTAFRCDINTTEYEALQSDQTGSSHYETLNDPKAKLNQSTDIRKSSDSRPSTGEMLYDKLQPCDTNQSHTYSSLSSPRLDEGENKFYENTVMSTKYIPE